MELHKNDAPVEAEAGEAEEEAEEEAEAGAEVAGGGAADSELNRREFEKKYKFFRVTSEKVVNSRF